jgi:hypothetical protein
MRRTLVSMLATVATFNLYTASALASRVAVLPTVYEDAGTGAPDTNAATDFHASILEGVEKAGAELIAADEVALVARAFTTSKICDTTCLKQVRDDIDASEALQVVVKEDREMASRRITITFAMRDPIGQDTSDGYAVVKAWLKGAVALALKDSIAQPVVAAEEEPVAKEIGTPIAEPKAKTEFVIVRDKPRKKISPTPLIIAGTTTLALGIATIVLDQVAHFNYTTIEENLKEIPTYTRPAFDDDVQRLETQQLLIKIFLGATGAGLLTTCVLAIFTDYSKSRKRSASNSSDRVSAAFSIGKNSGAVYIGGSF